jgi:hypothetical protein
MTRLIDANALKEYIDCGHLRNPCEVCFSELDVVNLIDEQPTIYAEPVRHGKWIFESIRGHAVMTCSECCKVQDGQTLCFTYCPNCGCRMDAE